MAVPEPATTPDHVLIWAASGGAGVPLRELLLVGLTAAAALLLRRFWARGDGWISAGETWPEGATRA